MITKNISDRRAATARRVRVAATRHAALCAAVAVVLFGQRSDAGAASLSVLEGVFDRRTSTSANASGFVGPLTGAPEASGSWLGPAANPSGFPPTDPREGIWNLGGNWTGGSFPDGPDDFATFIDNGDLFGYRAILVAPITLSQFNTSNEAGTDLISDPNAGSLSQSVFTGTNGLNINTSVQTFQRSPGHNRFVTTGQAWDAAVVGAGSLNKTGPGDIWLARNSSHNGGTTISDGRIIIFTGVPGPNRPAADFDENVLGFGTLTLNGGGMYLRQDIFMGPALTFNRPIDIGTAGGDIEFDGEASPQFNGVITGTGALRLGETGDSFFNTQMTYTGETIIDDYNFHTLQNNGTSVNSSAYRNFGRLTVRNDPNPFDVDRIGDDAQIFSYGGEVSLGGSVFTQQTENTGTLVMRNGANVVTLRNPGIQLTTLNLPAITRQNRSTIVIRGQDLGDNTGGASSRIFLQNQPALINGIVPWGYGFSGNNPAVESATGFNIGVPITYDANGLRPLQQAELAINTFGALNNVLATTNLIVGPGAAARTLTLTNGPITLSNGNITLGSGVIVSNTRVNTISANVASGSNELVIHAIRDVGDTNRSLGGAPLAANGLTISGVITGTNGLTKAGNGDVILSGINTYSGQTTVTNGRLIVTGNVTSAAPGPLGNSATPIVLAGGGNGGSNEWQPFETALLNGTGGTVTISRAIQVRGQSQAPVTAVLGGVSVNSHTIVTGAIDLGATTTSDVSGNAVTLTLDGGTIDLVAGVSGPGRLQTDGPTNVILRGNNTYSGGTELGVFNWTLGPANVSRVFVATPSPFGSGPVHLTSNTEFLSLLAPRTIPNNFVLFEGVSVAGITPITFSGAWDLDLGQSRHLFTIAGASTATWSGTFSNGGLSKAGAGTMILTGANRFSGVVQAGVTGSSTQSIGAGGVIVARHPTALGFSGQGGNFTRVLDGSSIVLDAANGNINLPAEEFVLNGDGASPGFGALRSISGNNIIGTIDLTGFLSAGTTTVANANIHVAAGSTLTGGDVLDLSGGLAPGLPPDPPLRGPGNATLTKSGDGLLTISRVFNTETASAGVPPITGGALNAARAVFTKKAIGGVAVLAGTLRLAAGPTPNAQDRHLVVRNLVVAPDSATPDETDDSQLVGGMLDLTNNSLFIDYTGTSPKPAIRALLATGYAAGAWNGPGIHSSAADPSDFYLGIAEATETGFAGNYLGTPIDNTTIIVRFTRAGDADLSGTTDIADFSRLAANFNQGPGTLIDQLPARDWPDGDFNYDQTVDIADFALLTGNFNETAGVGLPRAVPEPATAAMIALIFLEARRRRR